MKIKENKLAPPPMPQFEHKPGAPKYQLQFEVKEIQSLQQTDTWCDLFEIREKPEIR